MSSRQTPHVTVLVAALEHADAVAALIESAYRGEESRRGWTTEADMLDGRRTDVDSVSEIILAPRSRMLIVRDGEQLVGCCHVRAHTMNEAYLGMLSVSPRRQARGIGRALVSGAERTAVAQWQARRMRMHVIRQRAELISWYERLGYRLTGELVPFPLDQPGVIAKREDLEFAVLAKALGGAVPSGGGLARVRSAGAG
jgi:ribosomal protein S18 acetylase RimI-like enzyme